MYDVFVSYSSKDQKIADAVVNYLESAKIKCWIAYRDADAGELYAASIIKAIKNSSIYVLVFSENSNNSKHVLKEIDAACKYEKMIIPFKIDSCQVNDAVEYYLSSTHWLDAITQPIDTHLKRLVDLVNKHLEKTTNAPTNSGVSEIAQPDAPQPEPPKAEAPKPEKPRTEKPKPEKSSPATDKQTPSDIFTVQPRLKWSTLLLLSIFLGYLGIDRFYAGKIKTGTIKLLLLFTGIGGVWWIIDIVLIISGKFTDADGNIIARKESIRK